MAKPRRCRAVGSGSGGRAGTSHPTVVWFESNRGRFRRSRGADRSAGDLDGFKAVNDTFGHQTGDDVLCEVARRLDDEARAGDFCARLGGDEFVVVAENVAGPEGAAALARRVTQRIAEPFTVGPAGLKRTHLGVSIGIALRTEDNDTPLSVLARADEAAYRAKRAGTSVEVAR